MSTIHVCILCTYVQTFNLHFSILEIYDLDITHTETPYVRVSGNSSILATVGSRPVLVFTVAVDSNGLQEFHNNITSLLTFTFVSNSDQRLVQLPQPVMSADNFQHYLYTLPPLGINTEGTYTLTINGILYYHNMYE